MARTARVPTLTWAGFLAVGVILIAAAPALAGEGAVEGVRPLVGFEISEMKPKDSGGAFWKVGKVWDGPAPASGWRWKDHEADRQVPEGYDGDVTLYECRTSSSRDYPRISLFRKGATQGKHALRWTPVKCEARSWANIDRAIRTGRFGYWPPGGVPTHSSENPYYFFQRYCKVWRFEAKEADWSAWDRFRFDVLAPDAPVVLGVFIRDGCGPRLRCGPIGTRTAVAVFRVPKNKQVTVDFPLREMAAVAELDLTRVYRFQCRINGYEGATDLCFDNIRLAKKDTPVRHKRIVMEGEPKPFVRPVYDRPIRRVPEKRARTTGPVEPLGPVTIGTGSFGGSGDTYVQNTRRACVAYDNTRLLVVAGRNAWASFDGGRTWGGLAPAEKGPARLTWGLRANMCADADGNVYLLGTPNCDSYNEGHDICMFRLVFTGERWVDGQFSHLGQNGYKCTAWARALRLPSGRIWAAWCDGWGHGEALAKYSDDDGFTWVPCKDAALKSPRPFHQPRLEDLNAPPAERPKPPEGVLLWPASLVAGPFLVPYKGSVAAFSLNGSTWQVHDGKQWTARQKGPGIGPIVSEAVLGEDHVFLARGARFNFSGEKETLADLVVADLADGKWKTETLEADKSVADAILTTSGEAVFCLYVKKAAEDRYEVHYRRWKGGRWEPSQLVATEGSRVNHVAAPQTCPPGYAAVWWDMRPRAARRGGGEIRFVRVPNR